MQLRQGTLKERLKPHRLLETCFLEKDGKANIPVLHANGRSDQELYGIVIQKNLEGEERDK